MTIPDHVADTLQHIASLRAKIATLTESRIQAEEQFAHRSAVQFRAGTLTYDELADVAELFEAASGAGKSLRWETATGVPLQKLRHHRANRPNGPSGSWTGEYPVQPGAPRPMVGKNVVYVLFDDTTRPCYVGSTGNFSDRMRAHRREGKRWTHWTAYECPTRTAAFELENQLLHEHMPYLNRRCWA